MPIVESSAPSRSGRSPCGFLDSGTRARRRRPGRCAATGMLTRKIAPHQKWSSITPPISGPAAKPSELTVRPEADRLDPLAVVEDLHHDGERGGHQQRAADAHAGAGGDQLAAAVRETGHQRADAEQGQARDQHLLAAVAVGGAARGEQQTGLDQRIRVDHPLDVGGGRVQLPGEGGDRDVQDGVVEQHGELGETDDAEDQPALGMARGRRWRGVGRDADMPYTVEQFLIRLYNETFAVPRTRYEGRRPAGSPPLRPVSRVLRQPLAFCVRS